MAATRLEIALDNGHAELGGKIRKRPFEQGSLSRAGGTDEVQGKNAVPGETFLQTCRQFFVGLKNVANNWYFHEITPLFRFHALDIEFPSRFYGVPLFFSTERARCRKTFLPSGGKDLSALRTLEREGDFFGLQHSPFPIRPCRKSLERDG